MVTRKGARKATKKQIEAQDAALLEVARDFERFRFEENVEVVRNAAGGLESVTVSRRFRRRKARVD